jgi:hypothetical protein
MFANLHALKLAAEMCNGRIVERNTYHWYQTHVGDYPLPEGVKKEDLGHNAKYVFEIPPENYEALGITRKPYDLGLMEDVNNPGCLVPIYDFYNKGYGLETAIGSPLFADKDKTQIIMLCPSLKQRYDMACDILAAKACGDCIDVLPLAEAREKYPDIEFASQPNSADTWVSVITGERLSNSSN